MEISSLLAGLTTICGIAIDATAVAVPASDDSQQGFYDSRMLDGIRQTSYFGRSSVRFRESKKRTTAGNFYEQECIIQFPNYDSQAIARIKEYERAKFVYIKNSNGKELLMGRNDHRQNRKPLCDVQRDEHMTIITYTCQSIAPIGYNDAHLNLGLPHELPIFLFN
jgi:hypothetical protein